MALHDELIESLQDPFVIILIFLITFFLILAACIFAKEHFHHRWTDFKNIDPNMFYRYHTDYTMWNVLASMLLTQAFLLSNCGILEPLTCFHCFLYCLVFTTAPTSLIGSKRLQPVEWKLVEVSQTNWLFSFFSHIFLISMTIVELIVWFFENDSEHPMFGKVLFHVSLANFFVSILFSHRYSNATKFLVIQNGKVVQVLIRTKESFKFIDYQPDNRPYGYNLRFIKIHPEHVTGEEIVLDCSSLDV